MGGVGLGRVELGSTGFSWGGSFRAPRKHEDLYAHCFKAQHKGGSRMWDPCCYVAFWAPRYGRPGF